MPLTRTDTLTVAYGLAITATLMTVLEVVMAFAIVFPTTRRSVDDAISRGFRRRTVDSEPERLALIETRALLNAAKRREAKRLRQVNRHAVAFGATLIGALVVITLILRYAAGPGSGEGLSPLATAALTVAPLLAFQILFYFMSTTAWRYQDPRGFFLPILLKACGDTRTDFAARVMEGAAGAGGALTGAVGNALAEGARVLYEAMPEPSEPSEPPVAPRAARTAR